MNEIKNTVLKCHFTSKMMKIKEIWHVSNFSSTQKISSLWAKSRIHKTLSREKFGSWRSQQIEIPAVYFTPAALNLRRKTIFFCARLICKSCKTHMGQNSGQSKICWNYCQFFFDMINLLIFWPNRFQFSPLFTIFLRFSKSAFFKIPRVSGILSHMVTITVGGVRIFVSPLYFVLAKTFPRKDKFYSAFGVYQNSSFYAPRLYFTMIC